MMKWKDASVAQKSCRQKFSSPKSRLVFKELFSCSVWADGYFLFYDDVASRLTMFMAEGHLI